jgi:predicted nucleic acid-binding protein
MNVIIDTNIWSQALRKQPTSHPNIVDQLTSLLETNLGVILGPIRQELLTGFKEREQFEKLKSDLRQFPDFPIYSEDYELAAEFHSQCVQKGIQCSTVDILICAVAIHHEMEIFTLDKDFVHFQQVLPIKLYHPK